MTAAAPTPPPHLTGVPSLNGNYTNSSGGRPGSQPRQYDHIKDLTTRAYSQIQPNLTTAQLIDKASIALGAVETNLTFNRPDYAFTESIVAQHIISEIRPEQPNIRSEFYKVPRLKDRYVDCLNKIGRLQKTFDEVEAIIKEDNARSGVLPSRPKSSSQAGSDAFPDKRSFAARQHEISRRSQAVQLHLESGSDSPGYGAEHEHRNAIAASRAANGLNGDFTNHKTRPEPQSKPQNLQSRSVAQNGHFSTRDSRSDGADPLMSRFSSMRVSSPDPVTNGRAGTPRPSVTVPNVSKHLPKMPSPTYSPAKAMPDDLTYRTSQRSRKSITNGSDPSSYSSSASLNYHSSRDTYQSTNGSHRPDSVASSRTTISDHRRSAENMPQETEINAQRLYDYVRQFRVLIIDVRPREEFDAGHILHQHIICVEPAALRRHKSAEELEEALVLGPEQELDLFQRRNEFDLVVYHDQATDSANFLDYSSDDSPLRCLHESLYVYHGNRALKWQPILLKGGLEAWIDLVGPGSLQTSNTVNRANGVRSSRPISRRPPAASSSRITVTKKRLRDYNPIAPEEQRKWRERAVSESVAVELPANEIDEEQLDRIDGQQTGGYDDFQHRYPDVASVETQVLSSRPPSRPPPPTTYNVPSYPAPPAPSIPSRPPPALARPSYSGVSERVVSQSSGVTRSENLPPYIPPKLLKLPSTGLVNFGVTCYMNATIQCLSATLPLTRFFLDNRWQEWIQKDNWKGSNGLMPTLYNTLLTNIWRPGTSDTIRPVNFRKFCARLNKEWGIDRQQDAKEFLDFLLDTLHEDLNRNWRRNPLQILTPEQEAKRERTPLFLAARKEFERYLHRDWSKMTDLFAGQHISRLRCNTCGHTSTTYETFYSISVEIPSTPASRAGNPVSIHDCLRSYTAPELLTGDESWHCPSCRADREATKSLTISRAPEFLVIHLKRFSASHAERARKVHTPVDFPLQGLDMAAYMLPPPDAATVAHLAAEARAQQSSPQSSHAVSSEEIIPPSMRPPYTYDCYGVLRHIGATLASGHYIALVEDKGRGYWKMFNDDVVTEFVPERLRWRERVQDERAYLLFFRRVW